MLLELDRVNTYYGQMHILQDANLRVGAGELVCLLGGNASGKSTTLKTILGIVRPRTGTVSFAGEDVTSRPTSYRIGKGMAIVPENRRLFGPMTVLENLQMGAYLHGGGDPEDYERVYSIFPLLWVLMGGAGTTLGPLVGTLLMFYLVDISSGYTSSYMLVVGAALVLLVLWAPKGILGTVRQKWVPWLP